jgi:uncharacterized iron-regulated protein
MIKNLNMKILLLVFLFPIFVSAQTDQAFVIYNAKGKKVSIAKMTRESIDAQLILFGEFHDNPISHWLELELLKELFSQKGKKLILGFEMFEQDQQAALDRYLNGGITDKQLKDSLRLWPNYSTDYKPLILFAKENKLACIASNVERKYASLLFKSGRIALDTISPLKKSQMADLQFPIDTTLSQYANLNEMAAHMGGGNMLEAQALKDATMAKYILQELREDNQIIHYNGAYHSDYYQGILWYIQQSKPLVKVTTISTVSQQKVNKLEKEHLGKADFIICVTESMTSTH